MTRKSDLFGGKRLELERVGLKLGSLAGPKASGSSFPVLRGDTEGSEAVPGSLGQGLWSDFGFLEECAGSPTMLRPRPGDQPEILALSSPRVPGPGTL